MQIVLYILSALAIPVNANILFYSFKAGRIEGINIMLIACQLVVFMATHNWLYALASLLPFILTIGLVIVLLTSNKAN